MFIRAAPGKGGPGFIVIVNRTVFIIDFRRQFWSLYQKLIRSVLDKRRIRQRLQRLKLWIGGAKNARAVVAIYVES